MQTEPPYHCNICRYFITNLGNDPTKDLITVEDYRKFLVSLGYDVTTGDSHALINTSDSFKDMVNTLSNLNI